MTNIDNDRLNKFVTVYSANLVKAIKKYPALYSYSVDEAMDVLARMVVAFNNKTYNKDGYAIKWTCKDLEIPYTYSGINAYLEGR